MWLPWPPLRMTVARPSTSLAYEGLWRSCKIIPITLASVLARRS